MPAARRYRRPTLMHLRIGEAKDRPFIVEMAREASTIEDRPPPAADSTVIRAVLPRGFDAAVISEDCDGARLGAAWWHWHDPPLALDARGCALPEMILAVCPEGRGGGVGTALIEALALRASEQFSAIVLNVHIRNPAARLYSRVGFVVLGRGRGPLGVAMRRDLSAPEG